MAGFDDFRKTEKWATDQVDVANARQGRINAEYAAKQTRDENAELRKTLKFAAEMLKDGKHNKHDLDSFNKRIANLKVDDTAADDKNPTSARASASSDDKVRFCKNTSTDAPAES